MTLHDSFATRCAVIRAGAVAKVCLADSWPYVADFPLGSFIGCPVVVLTSEGNGEDPLLGHEFGRLYVEGYQNDEGTGVLKALATPKHFDVFTGPNNAECPDSSHPQNECDVEIGLRDWMTTFQPAFRGAIIEGKARSVMCSYNSINGQPNW